MMGHNICFEGIIRKIIPKPFLLHLLIRSTASFSKAPDKAVSEDNSALNFIVFQ